MNEGRLVTVEINGQRYPIRTTLDAAYVSDLAAYVGCLAGAIGVEDYRSGLREAGFHDMEIADTRANLNVYAEVEPHCGCGCSSTALPVVEPAASCCSTPPANPDTSFHKRMNDLVTRYDFNEYAASVKIYAVKQ